MGMIINKSRNQRKGKQETRARKMLLRFGKQHGNEEARICDLSTPQLARSAVQFKGVINSKTKT